MKFGIGVILVLGLIIGGSLAVYGIKNNEAGFWMWVGFVIIGIVLLGYYMKKLRENPPSKRTAILPFFLLQDTLTGLHGDTSILDDSSGVQGAGVDWLTAILALVFVAVLVGGIWILKRKDRRRTYPEAPSIPPDPLDMPPPPESPMQPFETVEEKRRKSRGKP